MPSEQMNANSQRKQRVRGESEQNYIPSKKEGRKEGKEKEERASRLLRRRRSMQRKSHVKRKQRAK